MRKLFCYFLLALLASGLKAQKLVSFKAVDGVDIFADQYISNEKNAYVLMFHQDGYSRGEYREIAKKLLKLGYNCLAVDLRNGNEVNFVRNETARNVDNKTIARDFIDCQKDITASIDYAFNLSKRKVVLFGSSFSASLSLIIGRSDERVAAVIAFSPGEYFYPAISVKDKIVQLDKPVYIACSELEYPYIISLTEQMVKTNLTLYKPLAGQNTHGAKVLWNSNPYHQDYWLSLLMFFKSIKYLI
jgi:dienelactone hydrolase